MAIGQRRTSTAEKNASRTAKAGACRVGKVVLGREHLRDASSGWICARKDLIREGDATLDLKMFALPIEFSPYLDLCK
jgi:hypothetical protein